MPMSEAVTGTTLQRPYLLRAMHEWMTDNDLTPHIVIDVSAAASGLPLEYAKDGRLVINVSYSATQNLVIGNDSTS
ncbi:MAG: stringent starvation protein B, partial [Moorea sp. SIO2B7]|nr:stringent starvation protein B [Moorena sp. SIO2B7]